LIQEVQASIADVADTQIAAATSTLTANVDSVGNDVNDLISRVDTLETTTGDFPDVDILTANLDQTGTDVNELIARVDTLETADTQLSDRIDQTISDVTDIQSTVEDFGGTLDESQINVDQVLDRIGDFEDTLFGADGLDTRVTGAETLAQFAVDTANDVRDSLADFALELRGADQTLESSIRLVATNLDVTELSTQENAAAILTANRVALSAESLAQTALNIARAAKRS